MTFPFKLKGLSALFILSFLLTIYFYSIQDPAQENIDTYFQAYSIYTLSDISSTEKDKFETLPATSSYQSAKRKSILIYHTHNRESWLPELRDIQTADQAFDINVNVTLLGSRLKEELESKGLDVVHSATDYPANVSNFNYALSYRYSKQTVMEEINLHQDIKFVFDLHRDSADRNRTTIQFNGENYAQVYFVVGKNNANWKQNMKFAEELQDQLNNRIPGISKGVYVKDKSSGNGEYNQSLSGSSALIEIGGVENTLEESYRTIDVLAAAIDQLWNNDDDTTILAAQL